MRPVRSKSWMLAPIAAGVVLVGSPAVAETALFSPPPPPPPATIVVHAGGVRTATSSVAGLAGATFTAKRSARGGSSFSCTTDASGTCSMKVTTGIYRVTETAAPSGWFADDSLDFGSTGSADMPALYQFETPALKVGDVVDVPGPDANGSYDGQSQADPFTGLLTTSMNNPAAPQRCGLRIALILDQSGSMASGGKQSELKTATKRRSHHRAHRHAEPDGDLHVRRDSAASNGTQPLTSLATSAGATTLKTSSTDSAHRLAARTGTRASSKR